MKTNKLIITILLLFFVYINLFANKDFATVQTWRIIGPYPSKGDNSFYLDYLKKFGGEKSVNQQDINADWRLVGSDSNGFVDLSNFFNKADNAKQIFYLFYCFNSEKEKNLAFTVGYTGGMQIWVNTKKVYSCLISRKPEPDDDLIAVKTRKGINNILIKII